MGKKVVVVGGGYGGFTTAKALDEVADVTLVERRDQFMHNVAALRAAVDPDSIDEMFLPYDRLLERGRVVHDEVVGASENSVRLSSGEILEADYLVLATGSSYPFPAKNSDTSTEQARDRYRAVQKEVADSASILIVGGGPVGLELAGEISSAFPDKQVTIVDLADKILQGDYPDSLRDELRRQLEARGVRLLLGSQICALPSVPAAIRAEEPFTVVTAAGDEATADIWFVAHGVHPETDYLEGGLAQVRTGKGQIPVTPTMHVPGFENVFALGDITAIPESKTAGRASRHADVVATNIAKLLRGDDDLDAYTPQPPAILIPLGPDGGASLLPGHDGIAGAEATSHIKGHDLFVGRYRQVFGLETP